MSFTLNPDGTLTIPGVDPTLADNYQQIQDAIDYMAATYAGGKLWLPRSGPYKISKTVVLKEAVELQGHGRLTTSLVVGSNDIGVLIFDASCKHAAARDLFLGGKMDAAAQSNAVSIAVNAPVKIERCYIWGGNTALFNQGVDGIIEDCFIAGWGFGSIVSNGANWYRRVKADTAATPCANGFYQGTPLPGLGVMENHFEQCDFSGQYANSVFIADNNSHTAYTAFSLCVFSSPIKIIGAKHTAFDNCAIGSSTFQLSSGTSSIVGCYGYSAMSVPGASKAGNINIS